MSEAVIPHAEAGAVVGHEVGFIRHYVFSTDHKMIGKQFLTLGLFGLLMGGVLAMLVRWELAFPETPVPGLSWVPEPLMFGGVIPPDTYNAFFTMHATIMIFFAVMPIMVGCFGNFLIPLMIGARDMAFPVLNMLSFWVGATSAVIMFSSFFVPGGAAASGWTSYAPLSAVPSYTGVIWGQHLWCISLIVLGISSLMGSINYITTIINMRAPGMSWFRLPLVIWSLFITAILLLLSLPVLTSALGMLLFDRLAGTHFFLPEGGGEPLLWQHLFWFFGHPEVYILILPSMGVASDVLSVFARKPIFGYRAMAPSAIKTFNWLGTLWRGNIRFTTPMLFAIGFVSMFVIGGLSGIYMASTPVDIFIHDTYYIVAHIHYVVFGGSLLGAFAAIYYWFPKMFGRMMNETLGKIHFALTLTFFNGTFFPMHIIGVGGHMRRIYNPTQYDFLKPLQHWNVFMTVSALLLGASQLIFLGNFFWSMFAGARAGKNPWQANTLEWEAPTPPPHGNFPGPIPTVYRGPYEYSSPLVSEDFLPQARRLDPHMTAAAH
ncbi:MAG: cytochrome c oxidase subunit I [Deltaproteobacteria bacterium]|nr:MAG: cytochrome c oxidase subunit I [Deltaproteobacteria bacterium]